ncbi:glucose-6-phosphate dehydrogenase [Alkalicoccobacillus murimartini]|uniref:Glucose-6-phosphate 1-dehydrogenase n=1 Tax=Alkalicoccobacillus murimartini TaxID=171685 RepID=A0ABT9YI24_9BACI|nr:glucose-6-phosphate dehydrogenase [Alkalicoccobacillus murimartini]MDQ0207513.1 glucose-6-phosphate 1-dehydrogenase [Alkalicoccobacillus murimartini]
MESMSFILFGATGDLAKRKIFPALFNLYMDKKLPASFSVVGVGKESLSNEEFQAIVIDSLYEFSRHSTDDKLQKIAFVQQLSYIRLDLYKEGSYQALFTHVERVESEKNIQENRIFYLSVAPELFDVITTNIKKSRLGETTGWKRVIIEKPFGHDLQSARKLNNVVQQAFSEEEIFRIDHYLGKPMVQNLETLISANPILQSIWSKDMISNVQITANETVGVGSRAAYYEQTGAIRDMVQNHMLQLVMMTAVRMSERGQAETLRKEKIHLMKSIQIDTQMDVVRGQYSPLAVYEDSVIKGYREEIGVDPFSTTDTFIAARLSIQIPLWQGVPFFIRTGKRLNKKETKIVVEFKNSLSSSENTKDAEPNLLIIHINPDDGVSLKLNSKHPLTGELEPIKINFSASHREIPEAYEYLLADAIKGDPSYFTHWDEVELAWQLIEPIIKDFENNQVPLRLYQAGSTGPEAANQFVNKYGFQWW